MKQNLKRLVAIALAVVMIACYAMPARAAGSSAASVGALLDSYAEANGETYTLTDSSRILVVSSTAPTGTLLQTAQLLQQQFAAAGYPSKTVIALVWGPEDYAREGDIVLNVDSSADLDDDGYKLEVGTVAKITAKDTDGLIYGTNMLMKCFRNCNNLSLIGFTAQDSPDTVQRAVSLDCGRKYYTPQWIKNFIRQMSWMGYNTLQLHFSDDGGFRADFWDENYYNDSYNPTNDFSWLCGSHVQYWVYNGNKNNSNYDYRTDPDAGKYLSTAELIDICNVAREYHIEIIPSFDSPSHMDYITWRYEQYANSNGFSFTYDGTNYTASSSQNNCVNFAGVTGGAIGYSYKTVDFREGTLGEAFALALYCDIADFFKAYAGSTDFSIGADEVTLSSSSYYEVFVNYINKLNGILNSKGYTMRMYNDFMGSTTYNYSSSTGTTPKYSYDSNIEILYWDSPFSQNSNSANGTATVKASVLANQGYGLYNCIQSNCYYVLRVANGVSGTYQNMDARNPNNLNWSFNYSTEQRIYETWTPNDFGEKGKYSTTDVVNSSLVKGAYFLIWNDYAALNTEKEVWNGVYDNTGTDNSQFYSLFDRMWSNTTKMWNWDVDDSVSYSSFKTVRDKFGWFPGFTSCSADASLPAATSAERACKADHSALEAALANKLPSAGYTAESYAAYEAAYAAALLVNADYDASAEIIAAAIAALTTAQNNLVVYVDPNAGITVKFVDTTGEEIKSELFPHATGSYTFYIAPVNGYIFSHASGNISFKPLPSGDGSGYISGTGKVNDEVTLYYTSAPNTSRLDYWLSNTITDQGSYTDASWSAYTAALEEARNFTVTAATRQSDIDSVVAKLESALTGLVTAPAETAITSIHLESKTVIAGKSVVMKVTTTPDVAALTVEGETLTLCTGKVQTLDNSQTVKIWLITFVEDTAGEHGYIVTAGSAQATVAVTVVD